MRRAWRGSLQTSLDAVTGKHFIGGSVQAGAVALPKDDVFDVFQCAGQVNHVEVIGIAQDRAREFAAVLLGTVAIGLRLKYAGACAFG
ncbi:hypothetical protein WL51_06960 [Burkholderia ubonensis]|nr:hypothetical protein WL51_06960 [Burkholderia ubonensis]